jgi:16S rRNA (guanine966-N2)-methyltransferase
MRIITGKRRGLCLTEPKNYDVRPTADRVKESLFNILGSKVQGAAVLDLFAGTGNLGLECWSRGAQTVVFVDKALTSLKLVYSNIEKCQAQAECQVLHQDALSALTRLARQEQGFDFIFCDPPYNKGLVQQVLKNPVLMNLLKPAGVLIVEHSAHDELEEAVPEGLTLKRRQKYGETFLSFMVKK